jgi:DNA helicase-2/ATP-dependent DNA helicase PcrA
LKHKDAEWATRWENVQELINFASEAPNEDTGEVSNWNTETGSETEDVKYDFSWSI